MQQNNYEDLITKARVLASPTQHSKYLEAGSVAACLITPEGDIFTGICIDAKCSLGFCAEHSAIAEMLKVKKNRIQTVVAVHHKGEIVAPCGRCRELMFQLNSENLETNVILKRGVVKLKDLLPDAGHKD